MDAETRIRYHLRELETALNPASPDHVMPSFSDADRAILDVGCGIGQTFVASGLGPERVLVGIDHDAESLRYGRSRFEQVAFVNAAAEKLPFADGSFDRIISRVTLPYTDIPRVLREFSRVLKQGGAIWLTLHPFSRSISQLGNSARRLRVKECALRSYVIANGVVFHCSGRLFRMPFFDRCESVQTEAAMARALRRAGFVDVVARHGQQFVMTASKPGCLAAAAGIGCAR